MAGGSVKLSIYSTFKDDGAKQAERAVDRFAKKFGELDRESGTYRLDDATRSLVEQSAQADLAAAKWQGYSDKLATAGAAVTKFASAEAGLAAGASVKLASDYEDAFAKVKTIMDKAAEAPESMSADILRLSTDTGKAATELAEATYQAISASVDTEKAVDFTGRAVSLAKAGFTSTTTAVDTLTTAINAYGMSADDAGAISDKLVQTQNKGKTTVDELASSIGNVIPTAAAYGVNLDNLLSAYVELTKQGINTANSTTYINGMLTELADEGSTVHAVLHDQVGKSFSELMAEGSSLGDVIGILNRAVDGDSTAFANMWGNVRAGKGALAIANAGAAEFNAELSGMRDSAGNVAAALDDLVTPSGKANKALNALKNTGIEMGEQLLGAAVPALDGAAGAAKGLYGWFDGLGEGGQQAVAGIVGVTAAAGPALMGMSKLAGGVSSAHKAHAKMLAEMAKLPAEASRAERAAALLGTTMGSTLAAAGLLAVAAAAVAVGKGIHDTVQRMDEMDGATRRLAEACTSGAPSVEAAADGLSALGASAQRARVDVEAVTRAQSELADGIAQRNATAQESVSRLEAARAAIEQYMNKTGLTAQEQGRLRDAVAVVNDQTGAQITVVDALNGRLADENGAIYDNVAAINDYVAAKKAQILQDALSENLTELYKQQADDIEAVASAERDLRAAESDLAQAEAAGVTGERWESYLGKVADARREVAEARGDLDAADAAISATESRLASVGKVAEGAAASVGDLASAKVEVTSIVPPEQLDAFRAQLDSTGADIEQFGRLGHDALFDLASAYDGSVESIVRSLSELGVEMPARVQQASDRLVAVLEATGPEVGDAAASTASSVRSAMEALSAQMPPKARDAVLAVASGISEGEPDVGGAASAISAAAAKMAEGDFHSWGAETARAYAQGILSTSGEAKAAAERVASEVRAILGHSVPKEGPLHNGGRGEREWGEHSVENYAAGMSARAGLLARAAASVAGAQAAAMRAQGGAARAGGAVQMRLAASDIEAIGKAVGRAVPSPASGHTVVVEDGSRDAVNGAVSQILRRARVKERANG